MAQPLTGKDKAEFLIGLENLCQHILYPRLKPADIRAVAAHFAAISKITDPLYAQVEFSTNPALRQTQVIITTTFAALQ